MNDQTNKESGILCSIIDGSVTIDSVVEFNKLIKAFPTDPWIYRFYDDLLKREKSFYPAVDAYMTAAKIFIKADMTLQAIVSKIYEWRILESVNDEEQVFYSSLRKSRSKRPGMQNFFIKLTYPEMMVFMRDLIIRQFPTGSMLKRFGE